MSRPHLIKRKPPPPIDLHYPLPDPADPFAPLSVLRNRASTSSPEPESVEHEGKTMFVLYPDAVRLSSDKGGQVPVTTPPPPPRRMSLQITPPAFEIPRRMDRIRNQSSRTAYTSDSGSCTEGEAVAFPVIAEGELCQNQKPSATSRLARFFFRKKVRMSLQSVQTSDSPPPSLSQKRVDKGSISPPTNFKRLPLAPEDAPKKSSDSVLTHPHFKNAHSTPLHPCTPVDGPTAPSCQLQPQQVPSTSSVKSRSSKLLKKPNSLRVSPSNKNLPIPQPFFSTSETSLFPSTPNDVPPNQLSLRPTIPASVTAPTLRRRYSSHHSSEHRRHRSELLGRSHSMMCTAPRRSLNSTFQTEWAIPTQSQLAAAASLPVISSSGHGLTFGSLFEEHRTIIIFIRHFWCPFCQDYMSSLASLAQPEIMFANPTTSDQSERWGPSEERPRIQLAIISNGSSSLIPKYRKMFSLPFSMYTDPSLAVYNALGMGRADNHDRGVSRALPKCPERRDGRGEKARIVDGGYTRHGLVGGMTRVVARAIKIGMPIWERGGDLLQLGGEFVFGPGLQCSYAHRMRVPRGHAPFKDVLEAAGVRLEDSQPEPEPEVPLLSKTDPPESSSGLENIPELKSEEIQEIPEAEAKAKKKQRRHTMQDFPIRPPKRDEHGSPTAADSPSPPMASSPSFGFMTNEEAEWMRDRKLSLEQLKAKKDMRRAFGGQYSGGAVSVPCLLQALDERKVLRAAKRASVPGNLAGVVELRENE